MLSREVLDLMAQAKRINDIAPALDAGFKALTLQIANLQGQVARLNADGVVTAEEKQQLMNTTSELAASFSTLQTDIPSGTVAEAPPSDQPQTGNETAPPVEAGNPGGGNGDITGGTGNPALSSGAPVTDANAPRADYAPSSPQPSPGVGAENIDTRAPGELKNNNGDTFGGTTSAPAPGPDAGGDPSGEKPPVT